MFPETRPADPDVLLLNVLNCERAVCLIHQVLTVSFKNNEQNIVVKKQKKKNSITHKYQATLCRYIIS